MRASRRTARDNDAVLAVSQALLGVVSPTLLGVAVESDVKRVRVYFAVQQLDEEMKEDINDIMGDVEVNFAPAVPELDHRIFEGNTGSKWEGRRHRLVYLAKAVPLAD